MLEWYDAPVPMLDVGLNDPTLDHASTEFHDEVTAQLGDFNLAMLAPAGVAESGAARSGDIWLAEESFEDGQPLAS